MQVSNQTPAKARSWARAAALLVTLAGCSGMAAAQQGRQLSDGPDVIVGILDNTVVYARANGIAALAVATTSCNAGNAVLPWVALPSNRHPVIAMNLYRLANGRFEQIGQSWVKHGVYALQADACNLGCRTDPSGGKGLGVGCSDPYGTGTNRGPNLGSRSEINPTTGVFDGGTSNRRRSQGTTGIEQGLQVRETDLAVPGARYFIEGHYVHPDDSTAGNALNNVSWREVRVDRGGAQGYLFKNLGLTVREQPAITAWKADGGKLEVLDTVEARADGRELKSRIIVGHKVTQVANRGYRYEYAVYNMNSDRGVRSFSVPVGTDGSVERSAGFSAVRSHGETWSNDPWRVQVADGRITWSVAAHAQSPDANAIRWGTLYTFWFESAAAPARAAATVGWFKAGNDVASVSLDAPAAAR